jgi:hypothetical protein
MFKYNFKFKFKKIQYTEYILILIKIMKNENCEYYIFIICIRIFDL